MSRSAPSVDELDPRSLSDADLDAWRALAAGALDPNPFFDPGVVLPAVRHLPDGDRVRIAVAREGATWLACVPLTPERSWRKLALPGAVGWQHLYAFLGTPLLLAAQPEAAAAGLRAIAGHGRTRTYLALDAVRADGPAAELLHASGGRGSVTELYPEERAALVRRAEDDYVKSHRSGKRRREDNRLRRRLEADLGAPPVLRVRGREPEAVERFLVLEASGWKGGAGTALASDAEHTAFFREIATADGPSLRAEILELGVEERPAAMLFNLVAGDTAYSVKLGHDESLQPGAPGVQLMTDAVGWWHAETDAVHYDSCALPENPMINALWPDRRRTAAFVITDGGARGTVAKTAVRALQAAKKRKDAAAARDDDGTPG